MTEVDEPLTAREQSLYESLSGLYPGHKIFVQVALSQLIDIDRNPPEGESIRALAGAGEIPTGMVLYDNWPPNDESFAPSSQQSRQRESTPIKRGLRVSASTAQFRIGHYRATAMRVVTDGDDGLRNFVQRSSRTPMESQSVETG
jgi:hypothetical protein